MTYFDTLYDLICSVFKTLLLKKKLNYFIEKVITDFIAVIKYIQRKKHLLRLHKVFLKGQCNHPGFMPNVL